jgi:L-lactate utilization protein LutB
VSLAARIATEGARMAQACTACGACVKACPMTRFAAGVVEADPAEVAFGMRALLLGEETSPVALAWIGACTRSAACNGVCPEKLDVALMMRFASMRARGALDGVPLLPVKTDSGWSARVKGFARLGLTEQEQAEWL